MIKKFLIIVFTTLTLTLNVNAGSDGDLILKKNEPAEVKDCFEKINRMTFALNQTLDSVIFQPVASIYRKLPSPAKTGVSNSLENISHLFWVFHTFHIPSSQVHLKLVASKFRQVVLRPVCVLPQFRCG